MSKKVASALFLMVLAFTLSAPAFARGAAKEARVEGKVVRSNKGKSSLTVRQGNTRTEKDVYYDDSTKWVSQHHGDKEPNTIDAGQVNDGDYVICLGWNDEKGEFHASMISKRLSHSGE